MQVRKLFLEFPGSDNNTARGAKITLDQAIPSAFAVLLKWYRFTGVVGSPKIIYVSIQDNNRNLQDSLVSKSDQSPVGRCMMLPVTQDSNGDINVQLQQPDLLAEMNGQEMSHIYVKVFDHTGLPLTFNRAYMYGGVTNM